MDKEIALSLRNISFFYKNKSKPAVEDFSLEVEKGSFTTLLGPSGCGKTTLLRMISGFLEPSCGEIFINGVNQKGIEPDKRRIGMVFQDYALFPHLSVEANILYGLKINNKYRDETGKLIKYTKEELNQKVLQIAENLDLQQFLKRYPHELSGGQQQRVALARALVLNPQILLMDEPLSSLDTKLRGKVREELKDIQQKFGITTIYVTHDQEEALSLSDKIAVINEGKLMQTGSPRDMYFKPQNKFTADFIGKANFLKIDGEEYMVRPEWFVLDKGDRANCPENKNDSLIIQGKVLSTSFLGDKTRFTILAEELGTKGTEQIELTIDLPTLESNFLEKGGVVSLSVSHKWKV